MDIANPTQRITVDESPQGLEIVITSSRNFSITWFYPVLLIIWGVVAYSIMGNYLDNEDNSNKIALLVGLVICSLFGGMIIHSWIYNLVGKERIRIDQRALSVKLDVYGFGITRKYDVRHISDFRPEERRGTFTPFLPALYRKIVFNYKGDTYGFGIFYDEAEAHAIVSRLQTHHRDTLRNLPLV